MYILDSIFIKEELLIGINSNQEEFVLAKRSPVYWTAIDGSSYIAISSILDEINSIVFFFQSYK